MTKEVGAVKKWLISLGLVSLLVGCGESTNDEADNGETNVIDSESQAEDELNDETETDTETPDDVNENEDNTDIIGDDDATNDTGLGSENNEGAIVFVPQYAETEAGLSPENDEVLALLSEMVSSAEVDDLGFENDVTIQFTGLYLHNDEEQTLQPIFIITNRTDQTFTHIDMAITFGPSEGELIFDETYFTLAADEFGILEPNTAMPVYVNTDYSNLAAIDELSNTREEVISIDSFEFESDESSSEGSRGTSERVQPRTAANESSEELTFVPTLDQSNEGEDSYNSLILSQLEELISQSPEVGIEGDVAIHWTGIYEYSTTEKNGQAVFVIVNRSGMDYSNIELGITFTDMNQNVILEEERFFLDEESFGVLEDQTIMPLYLEVPQDKEHFIQGVLDVNNAQYLFNYFQAEDAIPSE